MKPVKNIQKKKTTDQFLNKLIYAYYTLKKLKYIIDLSHSFKAIIPFELTIVNGFNYNPS